MIDGSEIQLGAAVKEALSKGLPVLALESTIITHGLPFPNNLEIALELEDTVRGKGVTPATIALIRGKIKIGLEKNEIQALAEMGSEAMKVSLKDIPICLQTKSFGATTVAGTMFCANRVGIKVFATGGIGGVHRGSNWDVSNDLEVLATTRMVIVSSGAKAILDLPATCEYLETKGVSIVGYQTDVFPAFYSRTSDISGIDRVNSAQEIAQIFKIKERLSLPAALLVANPVDKRFEIPQSQIEPVIELALAAAKRSQITGKNVTPFLLQAIASQTQGDSVKTNLQIIRGNVLLGIEIACALY